MLLLIRGSRKAASSSSSLCGHTPVEAALTKWCAGQAFESEVQKSTLDPIKESLVCCWPSGAEEDAIGIAEGMEDRFSYIASKCHYSYEQKRYVLCWRYTKRIYNEAIMQGVQKLCSERVLRQDTHGMSKHDSSNLYIYMCVCVFSGAFCRERAVEKWPIHVLEKSTQHSDKLARHGCKRDVCNSHSRRSFSFVDSQEDDDDDDNNDDNGDAVDIFKWPLQNVYVGA